MPVGVAHMDMVAVRLSFFQKMQLTTLLNRKNVFFQKGSFLAGIGICRPLPMLFVRPKAGILEGRYQQIALALNGTTTMVEMQVGEDNIRNIITVKPMTRQ